MNTLLQRVDSSHQGFLALVADLDHELRIADGIDHAFFAQFNKLDHIQHVVVAELDGKTVGCGAFKAWSPDTVEIKRMFVPLEFRGNGIAGSVLSELEAWAKELGYSACILETGIARTEAVRLYTKSGYAKIPNYGQYEGVEISLCMRKEMG